MLSAMMHVNAKNSVERAETNPSIKRESRARLNQDLDSVASLDYSGPVNKSKTARVQESEVNVTGNGRLMTDMEAYSLRHVSCPRLAQEEAFRCSARPRSG